MGGRKGGGGRLLSPQREERGFSQYSTTNIRFMVILSVYCGKFSCLILDLKNIPFIG